MALFRMAFFRLFALICRHFAWRISFFCLFAWRYFVFSLFRLAFFRYFVFSLGVISSWRRAITPGEKTKERNNEMAQTSHHIKVYTDCLEKNSIEGQKHTYYAKLVPCYRLKSVDQGGGGTRLILCLSARQSCLPVCLSVCLSDKPAIPREAIDSENKYFVSSGSIPLYIWRRSDIRIHHTKGGYQ